jgi:uridine kinase
MKTDTMLEKLIADRILAQKTASPFIVGFDGVDTSGKTSLADRIHSELLAREVNSARISIDRFHNPSEVRLRRGRLSPEGFFYDSFNYEALIKNVFTPLRQQKGKIIKGIFDYKQNKPLEEQTIEVDASLIVLFDGIFLNRDELRQFWDMTIFLDVSFETVIQRALKRDLEYLGSEENVLNCYNSRYIPGEKIYLDTCKPKEKADIVIDNNDWQNPILLKDIDNSGK